MAPSMFEKKLRNTILMVIYAFSLWCVFYTVQFHTKITLFDDTRNKTTEFYFRLDNLESKVNRIGYTVSAEKNSSDTLKLEENKEELSGSQKEDAGTSNLMSTNLISKTQCKHEYIVLILIPTQIIMFKRRENIRRAWASDYRQRWKTLFILEPTENQHEMELLSNEIAKYDDIIISKNYEDTYRLTSKIRTGLEWAFRLCNFKYLLKIEDYVFLNVPRLFELISSNEVPKTELYAGSVKFKDPVDPTTRRIVTKQGLKSKLFPRYCGGPGYLLTRDTVEHMINQLSRIKNIPNPDAYVGYLALKAGIDPIQLDAFEQIKETNTCDYNGRVILYHPIKSNECMDKLFRASVHDRIS